MSQPGHIIALDLHEPETLDEDMAVYYEKCEAKLGLVPNVIRAYAWNQKKLRNFIAFYNEIMLGDSGLSRLEREMIAMLDFAVKLTEQSHTVTEADRQALRDAGFSDADIWDISEVAGFFNMTNRVASATDMMPNPDYHAQAR